MGANVSCWLFADEFKSFQVLLIVAVVASKEPQSTIKTTIINPFEFDMASYPYEVCNRSDWFYFKLDDLKVERFIKL